MENENKSLKPFVVYPHPANAEQQPDLDPKDKLIYLAIRRYADNKTLMAYPSYSKITNDTGAAAKTIKKCVDKLEAAGYLRTEKRSGDRKIYYYFNNQKYFEAFSYDFLDKKDLSFTEKAYLIATQQYMYKDDNLEEGRISYTNKDLSKLIHMPESTVSKCNRALATKGYLEDASALTKRFKLRDLDLLFVWKFKEQDEKIEDIKVQNAELQHKVAILEEQVKNLTETIKPKSSTFIMPD